MNRTFSRKPTNCIPLTIEPCYLNEANTKISEWHRYHKPVQGHRWSLKVVGPDGIIHGVAVCGRLVARKTDQNKILEITRLATDETPNACSLLYGACARAAKAMGFTRIQTFILGDELGTTLKASGYVFDGITRGHNWNCLTRGNRRTDQPQCDKQRWIKELNVITGRK